MNKRAPWSLYQLGLLLVMVMVVVMGGDVEKNLERLLTWMGGCLFAVLMIGLLAGLGWLLIGPAPADTFQPSLATPTPSYMHIPFTISHPQPDGGVAPSEEHIVAPVEVGK